MNEFNVFVSVGGTATELQEAFVRSVEDRLRSEGLPGITSRRPWLTLAASRPTSSTAC
jgi:hypothetical protein